MSENPIQKIGRYEIEREIGRGGMAIVYKAHDPRLERPVAIKLIKMSAFGEDAFGHVRERFEREAKALARLDHPNILKVHDFGEHEGAPYLVMDYIQGATLKELKKPIRVDTAVKLLTPIADALEYVHRNGLLHRDIKPSNIMLTTENRVILTDFGIVKSLEEDSELHTLTATGVGIGTPEYMSPEQGRGKQVDARSDMYSLSIVFYELITGRKPFTAETPVDILLKQISEPLPDPRQFAPEISVSVKKFLDRAAAKNPDDRYPTTKEYLLDFEGLRLQAQANRAAGQTSSSGFQSLPRKTESTASSIEIGKADLAKVRAGVAGAEGRPLTIGTNPRIAQAQAASAKRIPWGALTFGLVALIALVGGVFGLQSWSGNSAAETREAVELAIIAVTAESGRMTAESGKATAEIEAITATKAKEDQILTGTAERAAQIATGTVEAEKRAIQATIEAERRATEVMITYEAGIAETQASIAGTATANAQATQMMAQAQTATEAAKYQVGSIIKFGRYEQDNNLSNGTEAIEWRVLENDGETALVVSVMGLDAKPYNEEYKAITWEDCTLRGWLNDEFYNAAFNDAERGRIALTHVVNEDNPKYSTDGGNDTEDHVFLLSIAEVQQYFRDSEDRKMKPTKYAIANGAWTNSGNGNGWWWLRSPGFGQLGAADVGSVGDLIHRGLGVDYVMGLVRPAMRIKLGN